MCSDVKTKQKRNDNSNNSKLFLYQHHPNQNTLWGGFTGMLEFQRTQITSERTVEKELLWGESCEGKENQVQSE